MQCGNRDLLRLRRPLAGWTVAPSALLEALVARKQQIGQMEALAALLPPRWLPHILQNSDLLFFCDNISALSGLISGHSPKVDTACILSVFHVLLMNLSCRVWGEYVESPANMADGPSREGQDWHFPLDGGCDMMRADLPDDLPFQAGAALEPLVNLFAPRWPDTS